MRYRFLAVLLVALTSWAGQAGSQQQQKPAETPRAARTFDPAAIRRQAAQIAEFRALLSDPDANIRLLTMREAIANGDPTQHELAIEAGLASNEVAMLNAALKGVLAETHQVVIEFMDEEGKPRIERGISSFRLTVENFDADTGRASGKATCGDSKWSGQLQGTVFSFNSETFFCSGTLSWSAETGDFRGRLNLSAGQADGIRNAVWRPR